MTKDIIIGGICERDLDLFLQEQFIASPDFCIWFADRVGIDNVTGAASPAERSKTDRTGESDIEVKLNAAMELPVMMLIENKVTAQFQPKQAKRYRKRAKKYVANREIMSFITVLVSPEGYFPEDLKGFDARVIIEEIMEYLVSAYGNFRQMEGGRLEYKIALLNAATAGITRSSSRSLAV